MVKVRKPMEVEVLYVFVICYRYTVLASERRFAIFDNTNLFAKVSRNNIVAPFDHPIRWV